MENQNIKEYILDLATECMLHSESSIQTIYLDLKHFYLTQAFFCAKKIQELYFLKYQNSHMQAFYMKFYSFNKEYAEYRKINIDSAKRLLKELKDAHSELKSSLSQ